MPVPTITGYCTVEEIQGIYSDAQDVIRIGPAAGDNLNADRVTQYIYDVERRIDARLAFKYTIPLAVPADNVINQIARYQTAYDIYIVIYPSRQFEALPDAVREWKTMAEGLLKDVIAGTITLTVPTTAGTGFRAMTSNTRRAREIEVRLSGTDWQYLGYEFIVPDSFIASPNVGITSQYNLDSDYEVLWREGRMRRVATTSIPSGSLIYLFFLYQQTPLFQEGIRRETIVAEEGDYR